MPEIAESRHQDENASIREIALDGVRYALLRHNGANWRLGSITPLWREEIAGLGVSPSHGLLQSLANNGIWLAPEADPPPLALMCCGLGASWTGMGRELYANFPAARAAMDNLASMADWDVLGLLYETNLEKINRTRWQIPYIFMLEYAQWAILRSLGLAPSLVCGHSLGELVGLCLAGAYDVRAAWQLFDTRAKHMDELESRQGGQGGMLAVSADSTEISNVLEEWPGLYVANRNTPRQYVLSGPRQTLLEARKSLRRRRIPAFMLNIDLAFHNPAMRVLRDLSLRRLNALEMRAPRIPMLSCVTAGLYPSGQAGICEYIADLDENTVDWPKSVDAIRRNFGISHFLELGPQEVLCGLINEIEPEASCLACDRKGGEAMAMRGLCARLFSEGYLSFASVEAEKAARSEMDGPEAVFQDEGAAPPLSSGPDLIACAGDKGRMILELLARETGREASALRADMDLRYDLGLRSSRFPLLAQAVERETGSLVELEKMFPIATVGDLLRFFLDLPAEAGKEPEPVQIFRRRQTTPPMAVFAQDAAEGFAASVFRLMPFDPSSIRPGLNAGGPVAVCVFDPPLLPSLWEGLAPEGPVLAIPWPLLKACGQLEKAGAAILPLACGMEPGAAQLNMALQGLARYHGHPAEIFLAGRALGLPCQTRPGEENSFAILRRLIEGCLGYAASHPSRQAPRIRVFQRWLARGGDARDESVFAAAASLNAFAESLLGGLGLDYRVINWADDSNGHYSRNPNEPGDMLAVELLRQGPVFTLWKRARDEEAKKLYLASSPCYDFVYPDPEPPRPPSVGSFQGSRQFSLFAAPELAGHGGAGAFHPPFEPENAALYKNAPWLPLSFALGAMLECAGVVLPWLSVIAFSDVRPGAPLALPGGISRECRIQARPLAWLLQEKIMTRICRLNLETRELSANGRKRDTFAPLCEGDCLLGATAPAMIPLWQKNAPVHYDAPHGAELLDKYYEALGFGPEWRLLKAFRALPGAEDGPPMPSHSALLGPLESSIACGENWGYRIILHIVEGIYQGCALALALENQRLCPPDAGSLAKALSRWRCGAIGYIRFGRIADGKHGDEKVDLQIRRSWKDGNMARFDAQAVAPDGGILLTLHHMEFEKVENA